MGRRGGERKEVRENGGCIYREGKGRQEEKKAGRKEIL